MIPGIVAASQRRGGSEFEWPYAPIRLSLANQVPPEGQIWEINKYKLATGFDGRVGLTRIVFLAGDMTVLGESIFSESNAEISLMPGTWYVYVYEEFTQDNDNTIIFHGYFGATIQSVMDWGTYPYAGMAFPDCEHLVIVPDFIPETFTTLDGMFTGCTQFDHPDVEFWDTSNIQTMFGVFQYATSFNANIGSWDTSNVLAQDMWGNNSMQSLFEGAENFNQDLSGWCVSQFSQEPPRFSLGATSWTLPKPVWGTCPLSVPDNVMVISAEGPIHLADLANTTYQWSNDLVNWTDVNIFSSFADPIGVDGPQTIYLRVEPTWPPNSGSSLSFKFSYPQNEDNRNNFKGIVKWWDEPIRLSFEYLNLTDFSVPSIAPPWSSLRGMFKSTDFNQDISSWDVSHVTDMVDMFWNNSTFNQDLSGWCVSGIPTEPSRFSQNATSWLLPKPIWGTCP